MSTYRATIGSVDAGETRAVASLPSSIDDAVAEADEDGRLKPARGIVAAVLLSTPIWMLIAFLVYRLV
ncbi:hypothetical protein [Rhodopila globiformis]|uniref:Uncharacterized protein n=1 Tax=Rhodopila globiformis TaxID=1071 RepID=A0A2S6NN46_RHOGL|nr:hypothetical protein [Rhodopila globiformis]PPQ38162.1 hypothetical protein CCS01_02770 [Rhodopila globiformis]